MSKTPWQTELETRAQRDGNKFRVGHAKPGILSRWRKHFDVPRLQKQDRPRDSRANVNHRLVAGFRCNYLWATAIAVTRLRIAVLRKGNLLPGQTTTANKVATPSSTLDVIEKRIHGKRPKGILAAAALGGDTTAASAVAVDVATAASVAITVAVGIASAGCRLLENGARESIHAESSLQQHAEPPIPAIARAHHHVPAKVACVGGTTRSRRDSCTHFCREVIEPCCAARVIPGCLRVKWEHRQQRQREEKRPSSFYDGSRQRAKKIHIAFRPDRYVINVALDAARQVSFREGL